MKKDITELFCFIDDFCIMLNGEIKAQAIEDGKRKPTRKTQLKLSEMLTIVLMYYSSPCKNFKYFYKSYLPFYRSEFHNMPCYDRFTALMPRLLMPMTILLNSLLLTSKGIAYIDSTALKVCNNRRIYSHKVFKDFATRGKTSMSFFYGFKLHIVINSMGELIAYRISGGNTDDRNMVQSLTQNVQGLLFGDKGYVSQSLFNDLYSRGLKLVTGIRKNMKNTLMNMKEKILLRKRVIVESVFDYLKNKFEINHTRHRSVSNAFLHILATLLTYQQKSTKPTISHTA